MPLSPAFPRLPSRIFRAAGRSLLLAGCAWAGTTAAMAQATDPNLSDLPPPTRVQATAASAQAAAGVAPMRGDSPLTFGSLVVEPKISYRYRYAEGMPTTDGRRVNTEIHTFAPAIDFRLGPTWFLGFTPSWTQYTARALNDTSEQAFNLLGTFSVSTAIVSLTQTYTSSDQVIPETAQQTQQKNAVSSIAAVVPFGSQFQFESTDTVTSTSGEIFPDSRDWSTQNFLTVRLSERTSLSLGGTVGYTAILRTPDMSYVRYSLRFNWAATDQLTLSAEAGPEIRHSYAEGAHDHRNPLLQLSATWRPFDQTLITLSRSRTVTNSLLQDQIIATTGWSAGFKQRLLGRLSLLASYNRTDSDYTFVAFDFPFNRHDRLQAVDASLALPLFKRWTIAANFQSSRNESNVLGFGFSIKQVGFDLSFDY